MLREGLRAEFPAAFTVTDRLRRPAVTQMSPALAALGAFGVQSITVALVHTLQSVVLYASGPFIVRLEPITVVGSAMATLFAFGSARWRGVLALVALLAAVWIERFWVNLPGRELFCDRSGTSCDIWSLAWPQLWPQLLGIALGAVAVRAVRQGRSGLAALAVGLGLFALSFSVARLAFIPFLGVLPVGDAGRSAINTVIGVQLVGALVAGLVIGSFGRRHAIDAIVLLVYFIGPWSPQLRVPDQFVTGFHVERDWQVFIPVGYTLVALLGLAIGAVGRRYRAERVPTIP